MTQQQYIINRNTNIVELGKTLGNISEACRRLGVSRQHYYDIKGTIQEEGIDGLVEKSRSKPRIGNRVNPKIEERVLEYSLENPVAGQVRVSNDLKQEGIIVSGGGVRGIWLRHNLTTKALRLKRLERHHRETNCLLTETQVAALESAKEEKQAHGEIETQQTGIDTFSNVGFAKLYTDKNALTCG